MVDLSIVIINYNTAALTCQCIQSILEQTTDLSFEIIVVDNHSSTGDALTIAGQFPQVQMTLLEENVGFGCANNIGMQAAKGAFILLLNSDTIVLNKALDRVVHRFRHITDKSIGLLACTLLNEDGTVQHSIFGRSRKPESSWDMATTALSRGIFGGYVRKIIKRTAAVPFNYQQEQVVGGVSGAFILLRREVFEKVGGFDPDFFMYCEETHWIRWIIGEHYRCLYTPISQVVHLSGKSSKLGEMQNYLSTYLYTYKTTPQFFYVYAGAELLGKVLDALALVSIGKFRQSMDAVRKIRIGLSAIWQVPAFPVAYGSRGRKFLKVKNL